MSNILMISGDTMLASGKKGAFYNTIEEFHKHWDRIDVICPSIGNAPAVSYFDNVFFHPSPWPIIFQPYWIYMQGKKLHEQHKFQVITVHDYPPFYNGLGALALYFRAKVPYVEEFHHIVGYPRSANIKETIYKLATLIMAPFLTSKALKVRIVNLEQAYKFLLKAGVSKKKLEYIPSIYIDHEIFKPIDTVKQFDLIFVGRLAENKGINIFLEMIKRLNCKAIIVGDGPLKEYYRSEIEHANLQDNVLLYGWAKDQSEIAQLMNKSKILIMPSYNEGGPRVVIEAMACGIPVLATPVGIVPDLVKDGYPIVLENWDALDISNVIQKLLANPEMIEHAQKKGIEIASKFEKKRAVKYYADFLKSFV